MRYLDCAVDEGRVIVIFDRQTQNDRLVVWLKDDDGYYWLVDESVAELRKARWKRELNHRRRIIAR